MTDARSSGANRSSANLERGERDVDHDDADRRRKSGAQYDGLVTGEAIMGANVFKDMFASVRDIVGGRSAAYEQELKRAKDLALGEMTQQAEELGSNAVISVDLDYETVGQGSMLMGVRAAPRSASPTRRRGCGWIPRQVQWCGRMRPVLRGDGQRRTRPVDPSSGATASTWGSAVEELARFGLAITYDRRGYARSGARRCAPSRGTRPTP